MLIEVQVKSLGMHRASNTPMVILGEVAGDRVLPIFIGPSEASAIAMGMADLSFERPLTHDLILSVLKGMGGVLQRVVITRVEGDTFYAELIVERDGEQVAIDARPSDSIALAVRIGVTILAEESLLDRMTIDVTDDASVVHLESAEEGRETVEMNADELKAHLQKLNPQDFGRFNP